MFFVKFLKIKLLKSSPKASDRPHAHDHPHVHDHPHAHERFTSRSFRDHVTRTKTKELLYLNSNKLSFSQISLNNTYSINSVGLGPARGLF
jgi:hypothetical protein